MCTTNKDYWDITHNRQRFLSFWVLFCPFIPLTKQKIKILKKWKKNSWRYYHFTFVYHEWQSYNVWFLRYEVHQTKSFLILDYFLSFYWKIKILKKKAWRYHQLTRVYHKWQSYDVWFLRYKVQQTEFFVDYFLPFQTPPPPPPLKTWKINIFIKWRKKNSWRYYHLYHKCINENHMMYGCWDMECDRMNFFSL